MPPTQVPATVVDRPEEGGRNETALGTNAPNEMEIDCIDDTLVENRLNRPIHADPQYPFPPDPPPLAGDMDAMEVEEPGNMLVENRSDAPNGFPFDPRNLPGVTSVEQLPVPLPPGLQRSTDTPPHLLQRSSPSHEWMAPACRR